MKTLVAVLLVAVLGVPSMAVPNNWLYSTDIASDLDESDPVTPANNSMDCGAIYHGNSTGFTLFKADGYSVTGGWDGYPGGRPQPYPQSVGKEIPGTDDDR